MKRLILCLVLSLCLVNQGLCADEWAKTEPLGTRDAADIDAYIAVNNAAIDRFLTYGLHGCKLSYASASTITVGIGSVVCSNSAGTIRKLRANTSATTLSWTDIDAGGEAISTTYYVYAVADADSNNFTCTISTSSSSPSGKTYYRKLGSFYNNSSGDITQVSDDNDNDIAFVKGQGNYYKIDSGTVSVGSQSTASVNFNFTFASAPIVIIGSNWEKSGADPTAGMLNAYSASTTGFTASNTDDVTKTAAWIAIGQVLAQ